MANWIKRNQDKESISMDAICLAETAWWGSGEEAYKRWHHGIYAWRQLCLDVAPWLHSAWERACEWQGGDGEVCFDSEFCEAIGTKLLEADSDQFHPYMLQRWTEELYGDPRVELKRVLGDDNATNGEIKEAIGRFLGWTQ